jgi:hypothetical protein
MGNNKTFVIDLWDFIKIYKKWWLLPIVIMLVVVSVIILFGSSSISWFAYPLF